MKRLVTTLLGPIEHGVMAPELLYESPFTDVSPAGADERFTRTQVDELLTLLEHVRATAEAS